MRTSLSVHYADSPQPQHQQIKRSFEQWRGVDMVAAQLDSAFVLPKSLDVWFADCGRNIAEYRPESRQVVLCYEFVDNMARGFAPYARSDSAITTAVWQTTLFVVYHEIGHGLIDILDLPTTGREEDAADQLATLLLLNGGEGGRDAALQGAVWFWLAAQGRGPRAPLWDEHSLDQQRYYDILCWVYGANPQAHQQLLQPGWGLPSERAQRCPAEFQRMSKAWNAVLTKHER
jgi:hypothetical protein